MSPFRISFKQGGISKMINNTNTTLDIGAYFHCKKCMIGRLAVGWTKKGLQVWCENCNLNVLNLDFKGQKVDAV